MLQTAEVSSGWIRRRETVSRRIEVAALSLGLELGLDSIKVEDVADRIGISRRTVYRYFGTIEDILTAAPKRALERISRGVRERPVEEGIFEAILNGARRWRPSEEDREIQLLGARLAETQPDAWFAVIDRMRPSGADVYTMLIAERLRAAGKDDKFAPLIGDMVVAAVRHAAMTYRENGEIVMRAENLERALKVMSEVFAEASAQSRKH